MVTALVSTFSPFSPTVGSTLPQQMGESMIVLRTSLQVSIQFILSVQIEDTNSPSIAGFISTFSHFSPPQAHSLFMGVSIIPLRVLLLAFNQFLISMQIHSTNTPGIPKYKDPL